jgi:putative transposase
LVNRDHVHLLGSIPPNLSVSRAVQYLKGRSSHKLLSEFGILRKRYWVNTTCGAEATGLPAAAT